MRTISGTSVPDELYTEMLFQKDMNRRLYLGFAENDTGVGCSNCKGSGAIMLSWMVAGPFVQPPGGGIMIYEDGQWLKTERKTYPCPICAETDTHTVRSELIQDSGLHEEELQYRLQYIDGMEGKSIALNEANMILANAPITIGFHVFFGDCGVGKSGILKSIVACLILMGVKAKYVRANDLLTTIRSTYGSETATEESAMKMFSSYQLIAVDEVDRVSMSEWAKATLFAILDNRYNMRNSRATLLAMNVFPDEMGQDFDYLMSRMEDGSRIPVGGKSLRGQIRGEQDSLIL